MVKFLCAALTTLALADFCRAQISIDGSLVVTSLGMAQHSLSRTPTPNTAMQPMAIPRVASSGSEIDQVFAQVADGRLNVLITGNLESNFNKLNVFIDSNPGDEPDRGKQSANAGRSVLLFRQRCIATIQRITL